MFDISKIGPLADAIEKVGAPVLAGVMRAAAPVAGAAVPIPGASLILPTILNGLADAVGGTASDPETITSRINSDPTAADKVQSVEATHSEELNNIVNTAQLQVDQNNSEMTITAATFREALLRVYFAGWRPAAGWVFSIGMMCILWATFRGYVLPESFKEVFGYCSSVFMTLIAARTGDKIFGVATNNLKDIAGVGGNVVTTVLNGLIKK